MSATNKSTKSSSSRSQPSTNVQGEENIVASNGVKEVDGRKLYEVGRLNNASSDTPIYNYKNESIDPKEKIYRGKDLAEMIKDTDGFPSLADKLGSSAEVEGHPTLSKFGVIRVFEEARRYATKHPKSLPIDTNHLKCPAVVSISKATGIAPATVLSIIRGDTGRRFTSELLALTPEMFKSGHLPSRLLDPQDRNELIVDTREVSLAKAAEVKAGQKRNAKRVFQEHGPVGLAEETKKFKPTAKMTLFK